MPNDAHTCVVWHSFRTWPPFAKHVGRGRPSRNLANRGANKRKLGVGQRAKHPRRESGMSEAKNPIDPNRLTLEQAAKLLSAAAKIRVSVEQIREDLEAGAPRNSDGTINLMHYAAWMVKEMGRGN